MFVSLQFKLELKKEDKEKLIKLMRMQSSAIRTAYNMLKELEKEKAKNTHAQIYKRLRQLFPDLPTKYIDSAIYKAKQYPTDKPVVFGGKRLFEKLCKNHLSGKAREKLKKQWRELRQGTLISIGSKSDKGNRLTRFEDLNGQLHLRITTGNREFIYAKVLREPSNSRDKWLTFMAMLLESWQTQSYFPYTVELKLRDGEVYGSVSFELPTPEVRYTKENGVIAIDTNASPIHLAVAEVSKTGELLSYQTISLHHLLGLSQNSKDHQEWILAHQIVDLAIQKGKAIAIENLKKLKKGMRGDGKALMLDIDNFKKLNDELGHLAGDLALRKVAKAIKKGIRKSDVVIRWGGEEFLLLLPHTADPLPIGEKIRKLINAISIDGYGPLSVSVGATTYREGDTIDSMIQRADSALYSAKRKGKNRVEVA
jgi:predicted transposase